MAQHLLCLSLRPWPYQALRHWPERDYLTSGCLGRLRGYAAVPSGVPWVAPDGCFSNVLLGCQLLMCCATLQAVGLRGYAQRDPLVEYKLEGYNLFLDMMAQIRRNTIYNVYQFDPSKVTSGSPPPTPPSPPAA